MILNKAEIDLVNEMAMVKLEYKRLKECLEWYAEGNHIDMEYGQVKPFNNYVTGCHDCHSQYFENGQNARNCLSKSKVKTI